MVSTEPAKIRRQVYRLSTSEVREVPVWAFASDEEGLPEQDEATVRPHHKRPIDPADGLMIVRAIFTCAVGLERIGYLSPPRPIGPWNLGDLQPVSVTDLGQVSFWFGIFPPAADEIRGLLGRLGKLASEMFPLSYKSDVPLNGNQVAGTIQGFSSRQGNDVSIVEL